MSNEASRCQGEGRVSAWESIMKKDGVCCTIAYHVAVIISLSHQHAAEHAVGLGLLLPRHDAKASESHVGEVRAERARKRGLRRREGR